MFPNVIFTIVQIFNSSTLAEWAAPSLSQPPAFSNCCYLSMTFLRMFIVLRIDQTTHTSSLLHYCNAMSESQKPPPPKIHNLSFYFFKLYRLKLHSPSLYLGCISYCSFFAIFDWILHPSYLL